MSPAKLHQVIKKAVTAKNVPRRTAFESFENFTKKTVSKKMTIKIGKASREFIVSAHFSRLNVR